MTTCSKSLLIFILFAVLWLELKARHCRFPHKKTHKTHKETTTSTASAATSTVTSAGIDSAEDVLNSYLGRTVCDLKTCKNGSEPFCMCALNYEAYFDHYPMSESGNCNRFCQRRQPFPPPFPIPTFYSPTIPYFNFNYYR